MEGVPRYWVQYGYGCDDHGAVSERGGGVGNYM